MKITSRFLLVISRARIGRHLLNVDLCVHIAANPDIGQIWILKTTSSSRTFGSHLKCGFVRLHWFYWTERSDFTETSVQCARGLCIITSTTWPAPFWCSDIQHFVSWDSCFHPDLLNLGFFYFRFLISLCWFMITTSKLAWNLILKMRSAVRSTKWNRKMTQQLPSVVVT